MRVRKVHDLLQTVCKHEGAVVSRPQDWEVEKEEVERIRETRTRWAHGNCPDSMSETPCLPSGEGGGGNQITCQDPRKPGHGGQAPVLRMQMGLEVGNTG